LIVKIYCQVTVLEEHNLLASAPIRWSSSSSIVPTEKHFTVGLITFRSPTLGDFMTAYMFSVTATENLRQVAKTII